MSLKNIKISLAVFTLFYTLAHAYKIIYCNDNGCTPETSTALDPDLLFDHTSTSFPLVASPTSSNSAEPQLHYNAIAHTTSSMAKYSNDVRTSFSSSNEWQIIAGSLGGILGAAIIAIAIFTVRYVRIKRSHMSQSSTDDVIQTGKSPGHEAADQPRDSRNDTSSIPVCIVSMDDASNSVLNHEWKQLMRAVYQQDWYNLSQDSSHRSKGEDDQDSTLGEKQASKEDKLEAPQIRSSTNGVQRS